MNPPKVSNVPLATDTSVTTTASKSINLEEMIPNALRLTRPTVRRAVRAIRLMEDGNIMYALAFVEANEGNDFDNRH